MQQKNLFLGLDFGTSGCRANVIDAHSILVAHSRFRYPHAVLKKASSRQNPQLWTNALTRIGQDLAQQIAVNTIEAIAVDGTSSTLLAIDSNGEAVSEAIMYNDLSAVAEAKLVSEHAPDDTAASGASSSLAKLLLLQKLYPDADQILHQTDWITGLLSGNFNLSDSNNSLKMGYDPIKQAWPPWLNPLVAHPPKVYTPGTTIGKLCYPPLLKAGYSPTTVIKAGTTDSTAAFLATGANRIGDAVTSLGSTLVLKILSQQPVFANRYGVYSHHINNLWLTGGASNTGGNVVDHYFSSAQIKALSANINPAVPTGLDYYPLVQKGERFPLNDRQQSPKLTPRPTSPLEFFQALLEGISNIEVQGYQRLQELGTAPIKRLFSVGGGAGNARWSKLRQINLLKIFPDLEFVNAHSEEAAYGAALLAKQEVN